MLFLATASGSRVCEAIDRGEFGFMATPNAGNRVRPGWTWASDNGCFADRWQADRWWAWLERNVEFASSCLFAVAPDVVADAAATTVLFGRWADRMRGLGYPVAYVGQDGARAAQVPWDDLDAWFTGGSTEWKLGREAAALAAEARSRGKHLHMGRVNSLVRLRYASLQGYQTVDGTFLAFGPDINLRRLRRWLAWAAEPTLF